MSDQNDRIKKIYALAMQGVDGEKDVAQEILNKLSKKYSFSLTDIDDSIPKEFIITYHGKEQEKLLKQIIFKITNGVPFCYMQYTETKRKCRTKLSVTCTPAQKAEISFLFDFYVRLWEKEKHYLMTAFIQKHGIYGNNEEIEGKSISDDELEKIYGMMNGLSDEQPLLTIEKKKGVIK